MLSMADSLVKTIYFQIPTLSPHPWLSCPWEEGRPTNCYRLKYVVGLASSVPIWPLRPSSAKTNKNGIRHKTTDQTFLKTFTIILNRLAVWAEAWILRRTSTWSSPNLTYWVTNVRKDPRSMKPLGKLPALLTVHWKKSTNISGKGSGSDSSRLHTSASRDIDKFRTCKYFA
jgi:hypothetical protein